MIMGRVLKCPKCGSLRTAYLGEFRRVCCACIHEWGDDRK